MQDGKSFGRVDLCRMGSLLVGLTHAGWEVYR